MKKIINTLSFPQDREYEYSLIVKDSPSFDKIQEYLLPYIDQVLDDFDMPRETIATLKEDITKDVKIAAKRFLENPNKEKIKFSTYFSWYIHERIDSTPDVKKKTAR